MTDSYRNEMLKALTGELSAQRAQGIRARPSD